MKVVFTLGLILIFMVLILPFDLYIKFTTMRINFLNLRMNFQNNFHSFYLFVLAMVTSLRAAPPALLNMWPGKRKLNEEKSKHAGLAQQIGFSPAFFHRMLLRLRKGIAMP
jgi:hypothetical protein